MHDSDIEDFDVRGLFSKTDLRHFDTGKPLLEKDFPPIKKRDYSGCSGESIFGDALAGYEEERFSLPKISQLTRTDIRNFLKTAGLTPGQFLQSNGNKE